MNKLISFFCGFLIFSFFIILLFCLIVAFFTIKELIANYQLDYSYQGCVVLFEKFKLCIAFIAALIPTATLIIYIEQRNIEQANVDSQEIKLLYDCLLKKLKSIKNQSICDSAKQRGFLIIKKIYYLNASHRITNKSELRNIVEEFIINEIVKYEDFECRYKFSKKLFYVENDIRAHSFDSFKLIAMYLLLPSLEYQQNNIFEKDLEELYRNRVIKITEETNIDLVSKEEYESLVR